MREGKRFDVSDVEAEMAAEKKKKEGLARGSKLEIKKQTAAEQALAKIKASLKEKEPEKLAKAREDLKNISPQEIESALNDLEAPEELSEEDLEEIN